MIRFDGSKIVYDTSKAGAAAERVQRVHLHPSKFGKGSNAPVLVNDCPLMGTLLSKKGKKASKIGVKKINFYFVLGRRCII